MKVIVITGSRKYTDPKPIQTALKQAAGDFLITGDARGADMIAYREAGTLGMGRIAAHAQWDDFGSSAGPLRNGDMVALAKLLRDQGATVECFAFPLYGSVGTRHCTRALVAAGFDVEVVE